MKNRKQLKRFACVGLTLSAALCLTAGVTSFATNAEAAGEEAQTPQLCASFLMTEGASVRNSAPLGIRFEATLSESDYQAIEAKKARDVAVEYGMVIMPYDYVATYGALTEANLFGAEAKYCFEEAGEAGQKHCDKAHVKRLVSEELTTTRTVEGATYYVMTGAIVNIDEENLTRPYTAQAYIKAGDETYFAGFKAGDAESNARSMTYVAQKAIEVPDTTNKDALQTDYIDALGDAKYAYTVVSKKIAADGTVESTSTQTKYEKIGTQVTEAAENYSYRTETGLATGNEAYRGYRSAVEESTQTVYANGKTQFVFEYEETDKKLLSVNSAADLAALQTNGDFTYLETFEGDSNVIKADYPVSMDAYHLFHIRFNTGVHPFDSDLLTQKFDYIRVRMYIQTATKTTTGIYSWNTPCATNVSTNQWLEVFFDRTTLFQNSSYVGWNSANDSYTEKDWFGLFCDRYLAGKGFEKEGTTPLFQLTGMENVDVTYYFSKFEYGIYGDKPLVLRMNNGDYTVNQEAMLSDLFWVKDGSSAVPAVEYTVCNPKGTQKAVTDGKVKFDATGEWKITVKATNAAGNSTEKTFTVNVKDARLLSFTEDNYSGYFTSDANVEYVSAFNGKDGVVKYTTGSYGSLSMKLDTDAGAANLWKMFKGGWDYFDVELYIEDSNAKTQYDFMNGDLTYATNAAKNQWIKVRIEKSQLYQEGSPIVEPGWGTSTEDHWNNLFIWAYSTNCKQLFTATWRAADFIGDGGHVVYYIGGVTYGRYAA